jgi:hypothetical protein
METKELWICVINKRGENDTGPTVKHCGKIVASFGTFIAYDSVDWALWHMAGTFTTSGAIYRFDISDPTQDVVMFHCLEDAMHEVETRARRYPQRKPIE